MRKKLLSILLILCLILVMQPELVRAADMPPTAITVAATNVTATSAILNGTVNANDTDTWVAFLYCTDAFYDVSYDISERYQFTRAATPDQVTGDFTRTVTVSLTGLEPNTTYHYVVKASNETDSTYGADMTFTTLPSVAEVNGVGYATLQEAVNTVASGGAIVLMDNITLTSTVTIASGVAKNFTIDLNGKMLDGGSNSVISHAGRGTLTITDNASEGGGKITAAMDCSSGGVRGTIYLSDGSLTVEDGIVENTCANGKGRTIINDGVGKVSVLGGIVQTTRTNSQTICMLAGSGTLNISGGIVVSSGCAIYASAGEKIIISDTAMVTSDGDSYSTIYLDTLAQDTAILEIIGGRVENKNDLAYHNAIMNMGQGDINITGGVVSAKGGMAIYADLSNGSTVGKTIIPSGSPIIKGGTMAMNTAPDLSGYTNVHVAASTDVSGASPVVEYKESDLANYKYLTFATFSPVTDITMTNSTSVQVNTNLTLNGTTTPSDASKKTIIWSVEDANGTGASITGNAFRATSAGTATVKATIAKGLITSSDYVKTFIITVTPASTPGPSSPSTPSSDSTPSNTEKPEGTVEKTQQQNDGAPEANVNNSSDELKTSVLTLAEQEMIARGQNAKITLKVTDISASVSDKEKKLIQESLVAKSGAEYIPVLYVDLSLYKQVGNQEETKVTETNGKIRISIVVPEEFWNTDVLNSRTFYVVRIHNGVSEVLEGTYDPVTHLFTFETDKFSTYALTYQDTSNIQTYYDFQHLQLTAKANTTSQTLTYKKVANVDGYLIYGGTCGEKMMELAKLPDDITSYEVKNLKKGTSYKYQVKAYRIIDGEQVIIMTSKVIHSITEGKTYANPTKVTSNVASVKMIVGDLKTVTCKIVLPKDKKLKEHTVIVRYESSDKTIATVNSKGKMIAKAKGTCYVYAYAQNGVCKKIKVIVE